jgi:anti-sigma regulatory factor (Ser/Thr protein kinase)
MSRADSLVLELQSSPDSVLLARHAIEEWASRVCPERVVETARLLVSELVTNVVRHAGDPFTVEAQWQPPILRVDVIDGAPSRGLVPNVRGGQVGGWGLQILEKLADAWGVEERGSRKTVWFEIHAASL